MSSSDFSLSAESDMFTLLGRLNLVTTLARMEINSYPRGTGADLANAVLRTAHSVLNRTISLPYSEKKRVDLLESLADRQIMTIAFSLDLQDRIALACTSRRIRTVLVSEPRLWTSIWCSLQQGGRALTRLASLMQLASPRLMRFGCSAHAAAYRHTPRFGHFIEQSLPRFSQLEVVLRSVRREYNGARCTEVLGAAWEDVFGALRNPAPSLRSLRLSMSLIHVSDHQDRSFVQYLPVEDLFSGQHPSLRRLHLRAIQFRLEPGISYPLLQHLVSLTCIVFGLDLTEAKLELLLSQAPQLIYLGLTLHGYVVSTELSAISNAPQESQPALFTPNQVKLAGFAVGSGEILSRFAGSKVIIATFQPPIQLHHFKPWPDASAKLVALGYSKEVAGTFYKLPRPQSDSQQLVAFPTLYQSFDTFADSHLVSELSISESQWEWLAKEGDPLISLPKLDKLCIALSTCIDGHRYAGVLWQQYHQRRHLDHPKHPPFPALKDVCIFAVHNTAAFFSESCRYVTDAGLALLPGARPPCPHFGTCRISLHDVSEFLSCLLVSTQQLDSVRLIGVTDIVDTDVDAAWSSVMEFTRLLDFDTPETAPLEKAGRFESGDWMTEAYPALDGADTLISDYRLRLNQ